MARDMDDDPAELYEDESRDYGEGPQDEESRGDEKYHELVDEGWTHEDIRRGFK